jgi:LPXTG-motif cell wall-anchored protein
VNVRRIVAATTVIIGLTPVSLALGTSGELSASSAVDCDPDYPPSDYPPAPECTSTTTSPPGDLQVEVLSPICEHDVPYLSYSVSAPGLSASTATITFVNPTGANYVVSGVPLQGQILWPGAVVNAAGQPVDWPGWTKQADGTWVPGDEWNWARSPLTVVIEVNPSATRSVSYPEATPACVAGPRTPGDPGDPQTLPATGSSTTVPLVFAGLGAAMLGGALTFLARRRSTV